MLIGGWREVVGSGRGRRWERGMVCGFVVNLKLYTVKETINGLEKFRTRPFCGQWLIKRSEGLILAVPYNYITGDFTVNTVKTRSLIKNETFAII